MIEYITKESLKLTGGAMVSVGLPILWLSALASSFMDNGMLIGASATYSGGRYSERGMMITFMGFIK